MSSMHLTFYNSTISLLSFISRWIWDVDQVHPEDFVRSVLELECLPTVKFDNQRWLVWRLLHLVCFFLRSAIQKNVRIFPMSACTLLEAFTVLFVQPGICLGIGRSHLNNLSGSAFFCMSHFFPTLYVSSCQCQSPLATFTMAPMS